MTSRQPETYRALADAAWRWVFGQVRWQDGPWIPTSVTDPEVTEPGWDRDGLHSGVGGLAHLLAEVRLARPWTAEEERLADAIAERVRAQIPDQVDCTFFDGLVSHIGALQALEAPGAEDAVARLAALATDDGWPQTVVKPPRVLPDARINDVTLGTAAVLIGAIWARRGGVAGAGDLAQHAAGILLAEAEALPTGTNWPFVPQRFLTGPYPAMPNFSHGLAGVAAALAVAAVELDRPDLASVARSGAEHLVTLGDVSGQGFVVPRSIPGEDDLDEATYTWCHGPTGTSLLFLALDRAGVAEVAGQPTTSWYARGRHSVRVSGLPDRLRPGFWDNDGRCCGTAAVGDAVLDAYARTGDDSELAFAVRLGDALVERAVVTEGHAYWRFLEHRNEEPLLPPGVGWMQGAAGIAAYLFRLGRVLETGPDAEAVARMENWWALDVDPRQTRSSGQ